MTDTHFVLDDTTLLALGNGNSRASALIVRGHRKVNIHLMVPTLCLLEADRQREGVCVHIGALEMLDTVDLDFPATLAVSALVRKGVRLGIAHARVAAAPAPDLPEGAKVATIAPELYADTETAVLDLNAQP
ncbi:hypothetical protein [Streptomyces oceani]|uniref:Uncharacterized protein n=1 Tax=Streptomyces oceani TaxID=1075402 RepID=A0A1E7KGE0_9ACTN|nr:hypothetical protein [Streptomyces oceani]OEV02997.1 hypothetical protein AN216_13575 [Streptomyces oceani]